MTVHESTWRDPPIVEHLSFETLACVALRINTALSAAARTRLRHLLPRLRRVAAGAELLVAPAGGTAADGALERCGVVAAAASRARPPAVAPRRRAFSTRAETTAQNAADVRDLLRTRLSMTDAEVDKVERDRPVGARATVEPKLAWRQSRLDGKYCGREIFPGTSWPQQ